MNNSDLTPFTTLLDQAQRRMNKAHTKEDWLNHLLIYLSVAECMERYAKNVNDCGRSSK